jgi:hypothetical protein
MRHVFLTTAIVGVASALPAVAATVTAWDTSNVLVGATPADYVTGESVVYNQTLLPGGEVPATAVSYGKITFTPPEAVSPGVMVSNVPFKDSGTGNPGTELSGCIKTSSAAACDGEFQSGKRIKTVVTDASGPIDLVFNIDATNTELLTYQVFDRLINQTGHSLDGFALTLGYGVGSDFIAASETGNLTFSTSFTAQPTGSGSASTQFPFGLFGEADTAKNFLLDGFFDDMRTGFDVLQTATSIVSTNFFGNYSSLFGPWMTQDEITLPLGLFWDTDNDPNTDALLVAWQLEDGQWELRRDAGQTCGTDGSGVTSCTDGATRGTYLVGSYADVIAELEGQGVDVALLGTGAIEDLANINLNFAIALGDLSSDLFGLGQIPTSFTLRSSVFATQVAAVPLPAGAPLLLLGLGAIGLLRRRQRAGLIG